MQQVLRLIGGTNGLVTRLMYGTGVRLMEAIRLRVQDVDFQFHQIMIRNAKGSKDRVTILPESLVVPMIKQLDVVKLKRNSLL